MNRQFPSATLFALCAGVVLALPAVAQTSQGDTQHQATAAAPGQQAPAPADGKRAVPPLDSRACIRDTGSHIPPPKGQCLPVAGSSYSRTDLQRTGATDISRALQMLDPSVTVRGH